MENGLEGSSRYCLVLYIIFQIISHCQGDFRQCLPVIPHASRSQIVLATISNASFWKDTVTMHLTSNMRLLSSSQSISEQYMRDVHDSEQFAT